MEKQCKCGKWRWTPGAAVEDIEAISGWELVGSKGLIGVSDSYLRGDGPNRGDKFCDTCGVQLLPGGEWVDWRAGVRALLAQQGGE